MTLWLLARVGFGVAVGYTSMFWLLDLLGQTLALGPEQRFIATHLCNLTVVTIVAVGRRRPRTHAAAAFVSTLLAGVGGFRMALTASHAPPIPA